MRRYDVVLGILLILSIFDFALAAPVLVREKLQAHVDVVQIPKDAITVFGKRGGEELDKLGKLAEEYLETSEKPNESSDAHTSSSSAPPGPDHGPINDVKAPEQNLASPPVHPDLLTGPLDPSPIAYSMPVVQGDALSDSESDYEWLFDSNGEPLVPLPSPTSGEFGSDHETNREHVPQPNPNSNPGPSTQAGPDPDFDWDYWMNLKDQPPPKRLKIASSEEVGQVHENQVDDMPLSNPPSRDTDFDWLYWMTMEDQPPLKQPKLSSSKEFSLDHWHEDPVVQVQQPNPGTANPGLPTELGHGVVTAPSPNPGSPKELDDDEDPQAAAIYAAKGKAKETRRRIPGTTRDVVNAVQTLGEVATRLCEDGSSQITKLQKKR